MKTRFPDPLSEQVIGCAMKIHRSLGFGFLESVFHRAMEIELSKAGVDFASEQRLSVFYDGRVVGHFVADLIVAGKLVVELKAVETISKVHEIQLVNYLKATNTESGLLLNFGATSLQVRRKFKSPKKSSG